MRQPQHLVFLYLLEGLSGSALLPDEVKADIASCRPAPEHMSSHKHLCVAARKVWLVLEACDLLTDLGSISASSLAAAFIPQFRGLADRCMEMVRGQQQLQQWKALVVQLVRCWYEQGQAADDASATYEQGLVQLEQLDKQLQTAYLDTHNALQRELARARGGRDYAQSVLGQLVADGLQACGVHQLLKAAIASAAAQVGSLHSQLHSWDCPLRHARTAAEQAGMVLQRGVWVLGQLSALEGSLAAGRAACTALHAACEGVLAQERLELQQAQQLAAQMSFAEAYHMAMQHLGYYALPAQHRNVQPLPLVTIAIANHIWPAQGQTDSLQQLRCVVAEAQAAAYEEAVRTGRTTWLHGDKTAAWAASMLWGQQQRVQQVVQQVEAAKLSVRCAAEELVKSWWALLNWVTPSGEAWVESQPQYLDVERAGAAAMQGVV